MQETFKPTPPSSLSATALTSLNALAHGGASENLFIPGEDPSHFFTMLDDAFTDHQPSTAQESDLVRDSVLARWFLARRQRAYINCEYALYKNCSEESKWTDEDFHRLNLLDRYKTQAERALQRSLTNVNNIRKDAIRTEIWKLNLERAKLQYQDKLHQFEAAEAKRAANAPFKPISPIEYDKNSDSWVIVQTADIIIEDGEIIIEAIVPTNEQVRTIIRHRDSFANPPQEVARHFNFSNNVPDLYAFLYDEDDFPNPQPDECDTSYYFSFEDFENLAKTEDHIMANKPKN
jgi:hypothetical protein